ncbi:MAG: DUF4040 domain-containing protein [Elusimicrobiota bacterium]|jgi:multicomponent Na+:H+ antiporter subunit B
MALNFIFLFTLVVCAAAAVRARDLLASVILLCAYSLVMTLTWTHLNAVDVALTEAAVGAGIVTALLIAAVGRTVSTEAPPAEAGGSSALSRALPLLAVLGTGAMLVYGTLDMPDYGDPSAPPNVHVASRYVAGSVPETGIVNFVTAILASYRGYDTFGETTVIFAAAVCAVLILGRGRRK